MTPISSGGVTHIIPNERSAVVAGAAAGNITVTGIRPGDRLKKVLFYNPNDGGAGVGGVSDLTDEFSITADDTINNTGGTATTDGQLVVEWYGEHARGGRHRDRH